MVDVTQDSSTKGSEFFSQMSMKYWTFNTETHPNLSLLVPQNADPTCFYAKIKNLAGEDVEVHYEHHEGTTKATFLVDFRDPAEFKNFFSLIPNGARLDLLPLPKRKASEQPAEAQQPAKRRASSAKSGLALENFRKFLANKEPSPTPAQIRAEVAGLPPSVQNHFKEMRELYLRACGQDYVLDPLRVVCPFCGHLSKQGGWGIHQHHNLWAHVQSCSKAYDGAAKDLQARVKAGTKFSQEELDTKFPLPEEAKFVDVPEGLAPFSVGEQTS